jgi:enoyl-CoA hydratase
LGVHFGGIGPGPAPTLAAVTATTLPIERMTDGPAAGAVIVRIEQRDPAGTLKPVVVLDHPLLQQLEATFAALPRDATGLVLASAASRVFIAGADLKTIDESGGWNDDQLLRYLEFGSRVFGMISALPYPTAAAINGAALGGGLEIAMHCDGLIALQPQGRDGQPAKPYPIGLPEAGLSLCPGWGGTNLLPARIDAAEAIRRTAAGTPLTFTEAHGLGLFDHVAATPGDLIPAALNYIAEKSRAGRVERDGAPLRWIGRPSCAASVINALGEVRSELPRTESAAAVLAAIDAGLSRGWQAALEVERRELTRLRHTPPAKTALTAFLTKSKS